MSLLDEQLEKITTKVKKLIEQNAQYSKIVQDLNAERKRLEKENTALRKELEQNNKQIDLFVDANDIHQQIDQYIQDIDLSIDWLSSLD